MTNLNNQNLLNEYIIKIQPDFEKPLHLGRMDGNEDIRIKEHRLIDFQTDKKVSRYQAIIWIENTHCYIKDDSSANGTYVNGKNILGLGNIELKNGDIISFVDYKFVMQLSNVSSKSTNVREVKNSLMDYLNKYQPTKDKPLHIGRRYDGDIRFPFLDLSHSKDISREHAKIWMHGKKIYIEDKGSTNGTFVNEINITQKGIVQLAQGDKIRIGSLVYLIENIIQQQTKIPKSKPDYSDKTRKTLLQLYKIEKIDKKFVVYNKNKQKSLYFEEKARIRDTNLRVEQGDFVVIMGPSGCGKSTALKIMCGEISATSGSVVYFQNNDKLYIKPNWKKISKLIGYVPQNDILHDNLSVFNELRYSAQMRLPKLSETDRSNKIITLLSELSISDCKDKLIKNISGGQRKRVSIALEMLTNPQILFLDEPTSPLDPGAIDDLLRILKTMNERGTTIVMVSHKEDDLEYANKVLFLGNNGYQVYYGPTGKPLFDYFKVKDTKSIYKLINTQTNAKEIYKQYIDHKKTMRIVDNPVEIEPIGNIDRRKTIPQNSFRQCIILTQRVFTEQLKDKSNFFLQLFILPIGLSLFVSMINSLIDIIYLFWAVIIAIFMGINGSKDSIVNEIQIYKREKMNVVKKLPYLISKFVYFSIISFFQALIVSFVFWFSYSYSTNNDIPLFNIHIFFLIYWLIIVSSSIIGLFISSVSKNVQMSTIILTIVLVLQISLSGVIAPIKNKGIEITSYFVHSRWATESLARNQDNPPKDTLYLKDKNISLIHIDTLFTKYSPDTLLSPCDRKINSGQEKFTEYRKDTARHLYDTVYKTIYQEIPKTNSDTMRLKEDNLLPLHSHFENDKIQISVWDTLTFVKNPNLIRLFNSLKGNVIAMIILNVLFLFLAWLSLWKKTNTV